MTMNININSTNSILYIGLDIGLWYYTIVLYTTYYNNSIVDIITLFNGIAGYF